MNLKQYKIVTKVLTALLAALTIVNIYSSFFVEIPMEQKISNILLSLTALFAIFYILVGCTKKEGAKYYQMFMIAYTVTIMLLIFFNRARAPFSIFFNLIIYGCLCVLSAAKDLGERNSKILVYTIVVLSVVTLMFNFNSAQATLYANICRALRLTLSITLLAMVIAKYKDKESRNTK